jgi:hypothetical protein
VPLPRSGPATITAEFEEELVRLLEAHLSPRAAGEDVKVTELRMQWSPKARSRAWHVSSATPMAAMAREPRKEVIVML